MNHSLISVIIPIYNAAPYLQDCVRSVLAFPGVGEVILIDDGSTDGSSEQCDALAEEYPATIRVSHQSNLGVSSARNRGICLAHGRWLWFVDADDQVNLPSAADQLRLREILTESQATIIQLGFVWDEGGETRSYGASTGEIPYNLWRCLFRRNVVSEAGLLFTLDRKYAEDQEFILRYLLYAGHETCEAIASPVYHYTMRPGSAMTRPGTRWKQVRDQMAVMFHVIREWRQAAVPCPWMSRELRRMTKSLWVTAIKK